MRLVSLQSLPSLCSSLTALVFDRTFNLYASLELPNWSFLHLHIELISLASVLVAKPSTRSCLRCAPLSQPTFPFCSR